MRNEKNSQRRKKSLVTSYQKIDFSNREIFEFDKINKGGKAKL